MQAVAGTKVWVAVGLDARAEIHVAAVLDRVGRLLGTHSIPTTPAGYASLLTWVRRFGILACCGIGGTGSYGAGLARWLRGQRFEVVDVERPPAGKDVTAFWQAGGRVRDWMRFESARLHMATAGGT